MVRKPVTINRPLESARGKPLRWGVFTKNNRHLLALFVFETHARFYAIGGDGGRVVEEVK